MNSANHIGRGVENNNNDYNKQYQQQNLQKYMRLSQKWTVGQETNFKNNGEILKAIFQVGALCSDVPSSQKRICYFIFLRLIAAAMIAGAMERQIVQGVSSFIAHARSLI